jgi:ChaB
LALNNDEKVRLPETLKRSPAKAQATYIHTLESAAKEHGDGEASHRIALASLKHSFEKIGDHWEPKTRRGPSDDQDAGGVDAYATKAHLMDVARRLDVNGRSQMTKAELVAAIERANRSASSKARRTAS